LLPENQAAQFKDAFIEANATAAAAIVVAGATVAEQAAIGRIAKGAGKAVDANKVHHIFGRAGHNLGDVVKAAGSREAAFRAMERAAQGAFNAGKVATDKRGVFEGAVVNVGGLDVHLSGRVIDGVVRIGTAWSP
jgi:hypothetical protein